VEQASLPVETSLVIELLRLFGKAARAHQLYLPNNPVYKAAHDALRAGFVPIWEETGEIVLSFTESEVKYGGETVLEESSRTSDSLPWIFYKDGVREIVLTRGFELEELDRLLGILQRVRKANPDEDDLLTLLWQGDYVFLRYRYVDVTMESSSGAVALSDGGEMVAQQKVDTRAAVAEGVEMVEGVEGGLIESSPPRPGVVSMSDFDATLYFLDEKEIEYLQNEVRREYDADLRQNVVAMLFDIFEQQPDPSIREETATALENLMLHMLASGQFHTVAYLVRESQVAVQRAIEISPDQRERLAYLPSRLSAPEALTQLLQTLDEATELPPTADLLELFEQLRTPALATVLEWLGRLQNVRLRPLLEQAAARLAAQNTAELVRLVASPKRAVALEAIKRAGALRSPAAVLPVGKVLTDGDPELRAAAVQALNDIGSPSALQSLERAVEDADRDVRVAAVRALQAKVYRPVLSRLDAIVKGKAIRDADLSEKMAVFEAYGTLCGEGGVAALDATLNGKSLFGRRDDPELRACAAVALGRVGTASALEALRRAANEKDVVVRNAVARALRGTGA
jgi:tetratricopeptide (TPR) repeat protein